MSQMNAGIILGGVTPDFLGSFGRGQEFGRLNALAELYRAQGDKIASGDAQALNALARFDPRMSLQVQGDRQGLEAGQLSMDRTRQAMAFDAEQMQMKRDAARQAAQQYAAQIGAERAAAEARELDGMISSLAMAHRQGPEAFAGALRQFGGELSGAGIDPAAMTHEAFPMYAAGLVGAREGLQAGLKMSAAPEGPQFRPATPEEAAAYGAQAGQINARTGEFKAINPPRGMEVVVGPDGTRIVQGAGVGGGGGEVGTIPQGFELFTDPETGARRMRRIPGGPEDMAKIDAEARRQETQKAGVVLDTIKRAREMLTKSEQGGRGLLDLPEAGVIGNRLANMGVNQEAVDLRNMLATLQSSVAFDTLAQMRKASPTGGALGAVSERELTLLQSALGALSQDASPSQLLNTLDTIESVMRKFAAYPGADQFSGAPVTNSTGNIAVDPGLLEFMTPEERALFE